MTKYTFEKYHDSLELTLEAGTRAITLFYCLKLSFPIFRTFNSLDFLETEQIPLLTPEAKIVEIWAYQAPEALQLLPLYFCNSLPFNLSYLKK